MLMGPIWALLMNFAEVVCVSVIKGYEAGVRSRFIRMPPLYFFSPRGSASLSRADVFNPDAKDPAYSPL